MGLCCLIVNVYALIFPTGKGAANRDILMVQRLPRALKDSGSRLPGFPSWLPMQLCIAAIRLPKPAVGSLHHLRGFHMPAAWVTLHHDCKYSWASSRLSNSGLQLKRFLGQSPEWLFIPASSLLKPDVRVTLHSSCKASRARWVILQCYYEVSCASHMSNSASLLRVYSL